MTEQQTIQYQILLGLSKLECVDQGDIPGTLRKVTEALSAGLDVPRASVWFYNQDQSSIICADLYEPEKKLHSDGVELFAKDFPAYFNFLTEERTLPAHDVFTHPATTEFNHLYTRPLDIRSMLEAPIRANGKMVGVVCNEQTGVSRKWTMAEQFFVGNIADVVSRCLQAAEKVKALNKLEMCNQNLEKLIRERTHELEDQRTRAVFASKMALLGQMAGSIAHEINNPLAIIMSTIFRVRQMDSDKELTGPDMMAAIDDIESTTLRIEKIVKGLRFFARDSNLDQMSSVRLMDVIEDTLSLCQDKFKLQECKLEVDVPPHLELFCQPVSISQVLLNLISNALDATVEQSQSWIRVSARDRESYIEIEVADSGPIIPTDVREKIMFPFFTTKPVGKGTGLGLAIVRGIIEQHKGEFDLCEDPTHTCFKIRLPKSVVTQVA